jgi:hypothetical protein
MDVSSILNQDLTYDLGNGIKIFYKFVISTPNVGMFTTITIAIQNFDKLISKIHCINDKCYKTLGGIRLCTDWGVTSGENNENRVMVFIKNSTTEESIAKYITSIINESEQLKLWLNTHSNTIVFTRKLTVIENEPIKKVKIEYYTDELVVSPYMIIYYNDYAVVKTDVRFPGMLDDPHLFFHSTPSDTRNLDFLERTITDIDIQIKDSINSYYKNKPIFTNNIKDLLNDNRENLKLNMTIKEKYTFVKSDCGFSNKIEYIINDNEYNPPYLELIYYSIGNTYTISHYLPEYMKNYFPEEFSCFNAQNNYITYTEEHKNFKDVEDRMHHTFIDIVLPNMHDVLEMHNRQMMDMLKIKYMNILKLQLLLKQEIKL